MSSIFRNNQTNVSAWEIYRLGFLSQASANTETPRVSRTVTRPKQCAAFRTFLHVSEYSCTAITPMLEAAELPRSLIPNFATMPKETAELNEGSDWVLPTVDESGKTETAALEWLQNELYNHSTRLLWPTQPKTAKKSRYSHKRVEFAATHRHREFRAFEPEHPFVPQIRRDSPAKVCENRPNFRSIPAAATERGTGHRNGI